MEGKLETIVSSEQAAPSSRIGPRLLCNQVAARAQLTRLWRESGGLMQPARCTDRGRY